MSPRSKKAAKAPRPARAPRATKSKRKKAAHVETDAETQAQAPAETVPEPEPATNERTEAPAEARSEAPVAAPASAPEPEPEPAPEPIVRSTLPDQIRSVAAHGKISQVAVSDDGELIAVASMSADRGAPTLVVHRTSDASEVCAYTVETIAGNGKAACFDAGGDLLFVAGDTLFRLKIGDPPQRIGRVDCEALFRDAAGRWLAFVERSGAVKFAAADAPLTEIWRHDAGRGHMLFGTQVRFIGGTSRALISGLADRGPLLVDVAEQKVLREFPERGACADATRNGKLIAVFEPRGRREDWLAIYAGDDAAEPTPLPSPVVGTGEPVAFAPDGQQLVKAGLGVQMIDVATAAASDVRAGDGVPGSTFTPALRAWGAPLIAWSSFNFRSGDFRAYWASFAPSAHVREPLSDARYVTNL
jgi:hypothetical protein